MCIQRVKTKKTATCEQSEDGVTVGHDLTAYSQHCTFNIKCKDNAQ